MALTLVEAGKLTQDLMLKGVIETIVSESMVFDLLPFEDIAGNGLTYNRESALPTAAFYAVGDTWAEDTPTFQQMTAKLAILGGDADVDKFLQRVYNNPNDLEAAVLFEKSKVVARTWLDGFYNGDAGANPKSFDGLHKLIPAGQRYKANGNNANGGAMTLDDLDYMIDLVKPGKPDALLMSKRSRRKLKTLRRNAANVMEVDIDNYGRRVEYYGGIPIVVDDFILDNRTVGTQVGTASAIYAVQFGMNGVQGIQNGGIEVDDIGTLETKNARRRRVRWYSSVVLFRDIAAACLEGISPA